jgi:hypothetical protein
MGIDMDGQELQDIKKDSQRNIYPVYPVNPCKLIYVEHRYHDRYWIFKFIEQVASGGVA